MLNRVLCVVTVLVLAAACGGGVIDELPVGEASSAEMVNDGSCTNYDCGGNGAVIEGVYFSTLYKPPLPFAASPIANDQGFRITHYYASENAWGAHTPSDNQLDVTLGKFAAASEGAILELSRGGKIYLVKIDSIDYLQEYWTKPSPPIPGRSTPPRLETYWFRYTTPEHCVHLGVQTVCDEYKPLCANKPKATGDLAMPAIVFEGDSYDQASLTVANSAMATPGTWFNIACGGSLPAKMDLIRRTRAAALDPGDPVPVTPLSGRQAFVNLWSANYCGDGHSYTVSGHPIRIRDMTDSLRVDYHVGFTDDDFKSIEAVWGPHGALCLGEPRLSTYTYDSVQSDCPEHVMPKCSATTLATWKTYAGAVVLSVNPNPE